DARARVQVRAAAAARRAASAAAEPAALGAAARGEPARGATVAAGGRGQCRQGGQGGPQRSVSVRQRQEVQEVPRGGLSARKLEVQTAPLAVPGFRAAGVRCGIKTRGADLALIAADAPCAAAGVFTRSTIVGAPVELSRSRVRAGRV